MVDWRPTAGKERWIKVADGEIICSECKGYGHVPVVATCYGPLSDNCLENQCPKCFGEGKLDWIENVVGKKNILLIRSNANIGVVSPKHKLIVTKGS